MNFNYHFVANRLDDAVQIDGMADLRGDIARRRALVHHSQLIEAV